ncbi:MAG TPA: hypothetical protein DIW31_12145 [Bacteroidales bacterium]|nr:hypothetical protein [Bacteroidales bacterium]
MKKLAILILLLVFAATVSFAQTAKNGKIKVYNVTSDQMLTSNNMSSNYNDCYWVETDETEGKVVLNFENIKHPSKPKAAFLVINIPEVQDASSGTGVIVTIDGKKIGSIPNANANSFVYINLDPSALTSQKIKLILIGGGTDGLAISSKSSGFGPILQLEY